MHVRRAKATGDDNKSLQQKKDQMNITLLDK